MDKSALRILEKLKSKGFEAFFAGGYARDLILGHESDDIDIATSAKPEELEKLFDVTIPVGKQFGVILVVEDGHTFEVATFRGESEYKDGRHPEKVFFTDAKEDALRRDFTINALFYDPIKEKTIDFVDGKRDFRNRILRFVGDPEERIKEDHLRILRAIRFKNKFDFNFHPETFKAIKKYPHLLKKISGERIGEELTKILKLKKRTQAFWDMLETGILKVILPEIENTRGVSQPVELHSEGDVFEHTIECLKTIKHPNPTPEILWAVLLHDVGKAETYDDSEDRIRFSMHDEVGAELSKEILKRMKFSKKFIDKVSWGIRNHMILSDIPKMREAKKRRWLLDPRLPFLLSILRADTLGSKPHQNLSLFREIKHLRKELKKELPKKIPKIISGNEIMEIFKISEGKEVGNILEKVEEQQILGKIRSKGSAIKFLKSLKKDRD